MSLIIELFVWATLSLYVICFIPQIVENYRLKTAQGWSRSALIAFFIAHLSLLYYTFLLDLYFPYKVIAPLQFVSISIITLQRFYYDGLYTDKVFLWSIAITALLGVFSFPLAFWYPLMLGSACGWITFSVFLVQPVPQVVKVYREKSVEGFSLGYVLIFGLAALFELYIVFAKGLPTQTLMMVIRNLIFTVIFCVQFWLYSDNSAASTRNEKSL